MKGYYNSLNDIVLLRNTEIINPHGTSSSLVVSDRFYAMSCFCKGRGKRDEYNWMMLSG